jgi:hypothetical protein
MAKGQVRSNRETKKPKKEKPKVAASAHFSARALLSGDGRAVAPQRTGECSQGRRQSPVASPARPCLGLVGYRRTVKKLAGNISGRASGAEIVVNVAGAGIYFSALSGIGG